MVHIKRVDEIERPKVETFSKFLDLDDIENLFKEGLEECRKWQGYMKADFEDLPVLHKGRNGLMVDMRLDGFHNYKQTGHLPCVYFRVGGGEYDFLPMIISKTPYIPYSFEQTIEDNELLWVVDWVRINRELLLKYADEEIGYMDLFGRTNEGLTSPIMEGKAKIDRSITGLSRVIWVGPYDNTGHYLRIKIQTPKSSTNSSEWASMSIPDLKLNPRNTDISFKEERVIGKFALINQKPLDDFANSKIDFETLASEIVKVDKKGNPEQ